MRIPQKSVLGILHVLQQGAVGFYPQPQEYWSSFNVHGEPILCTPEDAFHCFMGPNIETMAAGNCFLVKGTRTRI